jgi:hypothetical protein
MPVATPAHCDYLRSHDEDKETDIVSAEFVIEPDGPGRYRYYFGRATRITLRSNVLTPSVDEARASISRLRAHLQDEQWVRRHGAVDGSGYWFEIVDGHGMSLATSIGYPSRFAREVAIEQLQLDADSAPILARPG